MARKPRTTKGSSGNRDYFAAPGPSGAGGSGDAGTPPEPRDTSGAMSVLVEMRSPAGGSPASAMTSMAGLSLPGIAIDNEFAPVPMGQAQSDAAGFSSGGVETVVVRAKVQNEDQMEALRRHPDVINVYKDTPIAPFASRADPRGNAAGGGEIPAMAPCPIGTCDCDPFTPHGTIADVAAYLGANQVWTAGFRGTGIVVGVLDSGITAVGRPVKDGETSRRIARVIGGWPEADWGTESSKWGDHGNMCATDVLGMAPDAQLYDLRIAGSGGSPGTISRALQAFQWAINRFRVDGTPQILTNSWGIFQETWDATYARNPTHIFTRKVVEAIDLGILVLFAAGNCGDTCPDGRCGPDVGPGRSIWGANGHPRVMTVGAVNRLEQFIGYSSRGPAALDPNKPDFCSVSHFTGYFNSDSGTSAATPIAAGVVALLKQAKPSLTQDEAKSALKATAKDIGPSGFDQHSGYGIINAKRAFDRVRNVATTPIQDLVATRPALDLIATRPVTDLLGTHRGADTHTTLDVIKRPDLDPIRTAPSIDQIKRPDLDPIGTAPSIDHVKVPGRDTMVEGRPPIGDPRFSARRGRYGGQAPFALATPHHASNWQAPGGDNEIDEIEAQINALASSISAQQEQLEQLLILYRQTAQPEDDYSEY